MIRQYLAIAFEISFIFARVSYNQQLLQIDSLDSSRYRYRPADFLSELVEREEFPPQDEVSDEEAGRLEILEPTSHVNNIPGLAPEVPVEAEETDSGGSDSENEEEETKEGAGTPAPIGQSSVADTSGIEPEIPIEPGNTEAEAQNKAEINLETNQIPPQTQEGAPEVPPSEPLDINKEVPQVPEEDEEGNTVHPPHTPVEEDYQQDVVQGQDESGAQIPELPFVGTPLHENSDITPPHETKENIPEAAIEESYEAGNSFPPKEQHIDAPLNSVPKAESPASLPADTTSLIPMTEIIRSVSSDTSIPGTSTLQDTSLSSSIPTQEETTEPAKNGISESSILSEQLLPEPTESKMPNIFWNTSKEIPPPEDHSLGEGTVIIPSFDNKTVEKSDVRVETGLFFDVNRGEEESSRRKNLLKKLLFLPHSIEIQTVEYPYPGNRTLFMPPQRLLHANPNHSGAVYYNLTKQKAAKETTSNETRWKPNFATIYSEESKAGRLYETGTHLLRSVGTVLAALVLSLIG